MSDGEAALPVSIVRKSTAGGTPPGCANWDPDLLALAWWSASRRLHPVASQNYGLKYNDDFRHTHLGWNGGAGGNKDGE